MTTLAPSTDYTVNSVTQGGKKTFISTMRTFIADLFGTDSGALRTVHEALRNNGPGSLQNLQLVPSVASNALTMTVKTRANATPTAADPVLVSVRNATASSGEALLRQVSAALSLVISSGSTLGHTSAVAGTIYWYLVDSDGAGALKLAASSTYYGTNFIGTTVAEGGAGAADSATVIYSDAAYAGKALRLIGKSTDTQTTAGTWAALPSQIDLWPFDAPVAAVGLTLGTPVATTSGTSFTVTGLTGAKRITILFAGVSWGTGGTIFRLRIGPVGGVETDSTYEINRAELVNGNTVATNNSNARDYFTMGPLADHTATITGYVTLTLLNPSTNKWMLSGISGNAETATDAFLSGKKSLAGAFDRFEITTIAGYTFDAGEFNYIVEY